MPKYELLLALPGTLDENQAEARAKEIAAVVNEYGSDANVHLLGKNRLAYPIKQIRYGYFYAIVFNAEPARVLELQSKLALTRDVLRAMVSHYSADLTSVQKAAYTITPSAGYIPALPEPHRAPARRPEKNIAEKVAALVDESQPATPVTSKVERKIEDLDMESISKKLDDIMGGDVLPGV